MDYFNIRANELRSFLGTWLTELGKEFAFLTPWGLDVAERLLTFTKGGKLIRGGLVFLGQELAGGEPGKQTLAVGSAMELLQSAFLIHDDIMDRDQLRRGMPSVFWQYREAARERGLADAYHYGESMGICTGDCALFLALRILSAPDLPPGLAAYCCREVYAVGLAQMKDVDYGSFPDIPDEADILTLYTWKTGRYSFSLPLVLGAMLAGALQDFIVTLEKLGESLGIAFQMRDDELGLFGTEASLGKPIGSDIREGKKTLLIALAASRLQPEARDRFNSILGNPEATEAEVVELRTLVEESGARSELAVRMKELAATSEEMLRNLDAPSQARQILEELLAFISSRSY